jgi:hypothetical protein
MEHSVCYQSKRCKRMNISSRDHSAEVCHVSLIILNVFWTPLLTNRQFQLTSRDVMSASITYINTVLIIPLAARMYAHNWEQPCAGGGMEGCLKSNWIISNTCLCQGPVEVISGALVITSADGFSSVPPAHNLVDTKHFRICHMGRCVTGQSVLPVWVCPLIPYNLSTNEPIFIKLKINTTPTLWHLQRFQHGGQNSLWASRNLATVMVLVKLSLCSIKHRALRMYWGRWYSSTHS